MPSEASRHGWVALVGAGPGHPGLLTLRGRECLSQATVVVHDRLIACELLNYASDAARRIYVGKGPREHAVSQDGINDLLVELARAGERVVRLKGGDPFVFGRGGEEALTLEEHRVPYEIVPGVSSAIAAPAYAGIPVTHRGLASSFTVLTGHEDPSKPASAHDWASISRSAETLVVMMGVEQLGAIAESLITHGRPSDEPTALIHWGTTPAQRVVVGTLGSIARLAKEQSVGPPAVMVVGRVVRLRSALAWFERRPLFGLRVLVTRARAQASSFAAKLRDLGGEPIEFPTIQSLPPSDCGELDRALEHLREFDWVVFTSANGVRFGLARLLAIGRDARSFGSARICAIGPPTAESLTEFGLRADLVPPAFLTEAVLQSLRDSGVDRSRVLLLRADIAPPDLAGGLRQAGADVESVVAYRTVPDERARDQTIDRLRAREIDVVTFTSSSTVRNLINALGPDVRESLDGLPAICIGPVTAATARELGLQVIAVAAQHTIDGLLDALVAWRSGVAQDHTAQTEGVRP